MDRVATHQAAPAQAKRRAATRSRAPGSPRARDAVLNSRLGRPRVRGAPGTRRSSLLKAVVGSRSVLDYSASLNPMVNRPSYRASIYPATTNGRTAATTSRLSTITNGFAAWRRRPSNVAHPVTRPNFPSHRLRAQAVPVPTSQTVISGPSQRRRALCSFSFSKNGFHNRSCDRTMIE